MDELERQRQLKFERDAFTFDTPNCPECLHRMEPVEAEGNLFWLCPQCGQKK